MCSGACAPGSTQCADLVPETCDASGHWLDGAACPFACAAGACTGGCNPGAADCQGLVPRICDVAGQWVNGAACASACSQGACVPPDGPVDAPNPNPSNPTLLLDKGQHLTLFYVDSDGVNYSNVQMAVFDQGWTVTTPLKGYSIIKDGADVDPSGAFHLAVQPQAASGILHATNEGGAWKTSAIPGLIGGQATGVVDGAGIFHVASHEHLKTGTYASNEGGAWSVTAYTDSETAPASLALGLGGTPFLAFSRWASHEITLESGPSWTDPVILTAYGADQGAPLVLKAHGPTLSAAYCIATDAYVTYDVAFQTNASGSWAATTLRTGAGAMNIDLVVDPSGANHVIGCDNANKLTYWSDRTGAWKSYPIVGTCANLGPIDALYTGGRIFVAYVDVNATMSVTSFDPVSYN